MTALDFSLKDRVAIITGGAGLLGVRHAEAIAAAGGVPVLADIRRRGRRSARRRDRQDLRHARNGRRLRRHQR